jgi:peptide/nickel transport system permease protein
MNFIRKRILIYCLVLFFVLNLEFILPRLAQGSAAAILAGGNRMAPDAQQLIIARFGLDKPLYVQYFLFLKGVFSWPPDFGQSYAFYPQSVTTLFLQRLPWTLLLIISSLTLSILISTSLITYLALRRGGKFELGFLYSTVSLQGIPVYWVSMVLVWVFGSKLGWFPSFGSVAFNPGTGLSYIGSVLQHAALPIIAMTGVLVAYQNLVLRGAMQEVLKSDYVLASKTRGLKNRTISRTYILRNSLLPYVSQLSFFWAQAIGVVILIEAVFGYNGVGDLIVDGIFNRDFPVVNGSLFFVSILAIAGGLVGDLILLRLDPRLKTGDK